jgi:hypothetical protein
MSLYLFVLFLFALLLLSLVQAVCEVQDLLRQGLYSTTTNSTHLDSVMYIATSGLR